MDIKSGVGYPATALTNFAPHRFIFDDVLCESMEGLVQNLKFKNPEMQAYVCTLVGLKAKYKGKKKVWWRDQTLYWKGHAINRHNQEYQDLLDRAYIALAEQSKSFRDALSRTGFAVLRHSEGKRDASRTVLMEQEFCSRLMRVRKLIVSGEIKGA